MPFILLIALVISGAAEAEPLVLRGATMGTTYEIKIVADRVSIDRRALQSDIESLLAEIDRQMSTYRPDSELSRFNRARAGEWFPVSKATAEVTAAAQAMSDKTAGALDVTVGPLVRLWHFGPPDSAAPKSRRAFEPPADEAIAAARRKIGYQKLKVRTEPPALRKEVDGLEVDLSSIAPGYAIDRLSVLLIERGFANHMVEIGGEVRAAGQRGDGKPWRIAVERPDSQRRAMQTAVPLENASIATAGDYQKFFEYAGRRYSHIIDPARGRPIEHSLASVTVVAGTCMVADAWDTPLLVLGPERGFECAEKHHIAALFIAHGAGDAVRATSAWRARFGE